MELISELLKVISSAKAVHNSLIKNPSFPDQVLSLGGKYGWNTVKPTLQAIFDEVSSMGINEYCQFLLKISHQPSEARKNVCQGLTTSVLHVLSREPDTKATSYLSHNNPRSMNFVCLLFKLFISLECNQQFISFVQVLCSKPNRYPVIDILVHH